MRASPGSQRLPARDAPPVLGLVPAPHIEINRLGLLMSPTSGPAALTIATATRPRRSQVRDEDFIGGLDKRGFPVVHVPFDTRQLRACWGIAAPGRIAHDFAAAVVGMGGRICGVGAGHLPRSQVPPGRVWLVPKGVLGYLVEYGWAPRE